MMIKKIKSNTHCLDVFMNGLMVGHLIRGTARDLLFTYDQSWLVRDQAMPISHSLPLREKAFTGPGVNNYFDNLLPDDLRMLERIAVSVQAKSSHAFDILETIGHDCVGALQFYSEGKEPGQVKPVKGRPISDIEIADLIKNLRINPLGISQEQEFRISLAGVQRKTALLRVDGKWYFPEGATPTTHILKPAIGFIPEGPDFSLSIENEWLCLKILKAFGLKAAVAEMVDFEGVKVLVIERFDRSWSGKKLFRLPQEDFCQATGMGPSRKYESDGGPGMGPILALLNESDQRDLDRKDFIKAQLVYWLLAAVDGHAKNFSVFIRPSGLVLAPFYDVMSADPHINSKNFPIQKIKLAMSVGNERHYKVSEILPKHWKQTAVKNKLINIESILSEVAQLAPQVIETINDELPKGFPACVSDPIFRGLSKRAKKLSMA